MSDSGPLIAPVTTTLTHDATLEALRSAILDGRLRPGDRLKEEELATMLGTSRTPIRRSLAILQEEGLVEVLPRRGARVRSFGAEELDDIYQLRSVLEAHSAALASDNMTDEGLTDLRASCERFESLHQRGDVVGAVAENLFFHNAILDLAGSARLKQMVNSVIVLPIVYRAYYWFDDDQRRTAEHRHYELVEAFSEGQRDEAAKVMEIHTLEARDLLVARAHERDLAAANLDGVDG
ncbi:MAG TPA: GntR family transcriptional regulator [Solirubrobacterales bacterium]